MSYKLAIFDMDGTVLYTLQDLQNGVNYALSKNNLSTRTIEEIRNFVGNGIRKTIELAVPSGTTGDIVQKVYEDFNVFYKVHNNDNTRPYDGIQDALKELKQHGIKTAVVSNKSDYAVQMLVKDYFDGLFDVSMGENENRAKKPSPDMVNEVLQTLNIKKQDAVYIGDSDVDFATAKNSELDFIGVSWGFKGRPFLENLNAKNVIDSARELIPLIVGK